MEARANQQSHPACLTAAEKRRRDCMPGVALRKRRGPFDGQIQSCCIVSEAPISADIQLSARGPGAIRGPFFAGSGDCA